MMYRILKFFAILLFANVNCLFAEPYQVIHKRKACCCHKKKEVYFKIFKNPNLEIENYINDVHYKRLNDYKINQINKYKRLSNDNNMFMFNIMLSINNNFEDYFMAVKIGYYTRAIDVLVHKFNNGDIYEKYLSHLFLKSSYIYLSKLSETQRPSYKSIDALYYEGNRTYINLDKKYVEKFENYNYNTIADRSKLCYDIIAYKNWEDEYRKYIEWADENAVSDINKSHQTRIGEINIDKINHEY